MKVLNDNYKIMKQFQDNVETDKVMPPEVAEFLYTTPLTKVYDSLSKTLKDNKVVTEDSVLEQKRISKMVDSIVKV
jgi:hypothetical protein